MVKQKHDIKCHFLLKTDLFKRREYLVKGIGLVFEYNLP